MSALISLAVLSFLADEPEMTVPLIPDPPPVVDGRLDEWQMRPLKRTYRNPAQVVWGKQCWTGPADLSGWATFGWDNRYLYVAVHVVDDKHCQTNRGRDLYRGDHLELFVHVPGVGGNEKTGVVFQIGLSPGNFARTGDPLTDIAPEAIVYAPDGRHVSAIVAAHRISDGYELEAALPWPELTIKKPELGLPLGIDLCLGDTDTDTPVQETLSSLLTSPWKVRSPDRMVRVRLGNADGKAPARTDVAEKAQPILALAKLDPGKQQDVTFTADKRPANTKAILVLDARLECESVAGGTHALDLAMNGTPIETERLVNRPPEFTFADGRILSSWKRLGFFVYYSPDFKAVETTKNRYKPIDAPAYRFELLVDDLVKDAPSGNTLRIKHDCSSINRAMIVQNVRLVHRDAAALAARHEDAGPPTGPLPVREPRAKTKVDYEWALLDGGALRITVAGESFLVESRFSHPTPGWLSMTGGDRKPASPVERETPYWRLRREVEPLAECLIVKDTFTSTGNEDVGIMARHEVPLGDRLDRLYVNGLYVAGKSAANGDSANPSTVGLTRRAGIALMPEDDVFRVHSLNYGQAGAIGLADNHFVLRPGKTHTMRWAIYPLDEPDHFAFVNAARRRLGTNFRIDGSFTFVAQRPPFTGFTDEQLRDYARFKGAKYVSHSIVLPLYQGKYPHGTAFPLVSHEPYRKLFARFRKVDPDIQTSVYFHCFISVEEGARAKYKDAVLLKPDGTQGDYRNPIYPIFIPTEDNSYGPAVAKNVEIILGEIGADGVYWDELAYSAFKYHFGEPWDGVTADIDPKTMTITRRKSSVALITQPWRLKLARRILDAGKHLIGNGNPHTETFTKLHFPRFVETASATNLARSLLYTPIGLGDHLGERNEVHAYRNMVRYLDWGGVYYWYHDQIVPTRPTLTSWMFPVTPVELHEGYLIAQERILTNRSGLFGWGDTSAFEAVVFDKFGRRDAGAKVPLVQRDGKHYAEVRIGKGCAAAIIRK
ncbi:MAG: hypothetical protein JXQ73_28100 [Phycisphaerae bacterium]|nr:hypothetical protein [Phycisphaerae bacterium]